MNRRFLPLCLIGSGLLLSSCEREQISLGDLESRLEKLESSFSVVKKTANQLRRDLAVVTETRSKLEVEADASRSAVLQIKADRDALVQSFVSYRTEYHDSIIKRATGMELGNLTVDGVTYEGARVKSLDPWELAVQHYAGVTRIDLVDLPENLQALLGYDPSVGPKPEADLVAAGDPVAPTLSVDQAKTVAAAPKRAPASRRPAAAPVSALAKAANECSGGSDNLIVRFSGVGMNGMSGGASSIRGGKSELPEGYKPIGSSYSGTAMDRVHKKERR